MVHEAVISLFLLSVGSAVRVTKVELDNELSTQVQNEELPGAFNCTQRRHEFISLLSASLTPEQRMSKMSVLASEECGMRLNENVIKHRYDGFCQHSGKVFGLGMFKTGTSSLVEALNNLGYISTKETRAYFAGYGSCILCVYEHLTLCQTSINPNSNSNHDPNYHV